jgi:hypothetical protein
MLIYLFIDLLIYAQTAGIPGLWFAQDGPDYWEKITPATHTLGVRRA